MISQDKSLGAQLDSAIQADPATYPVLDRAKYPEVYSYLENMRDDILRSDYINYKDDFVWKLTIIDDKTLNAFAAPGGYIYFYTGIISYLDSASHLAGVMGHEMAHADRRHSMKQMWQNLGVSILLKVITGGDAEALQKVLGGLVGLKFSREDERDADRFSVRYLSDTDFDP
ncbi:MAG: M48 family metalloprotease, partial [Bacteroidales bacterium]|nr:M48 family metalloprotease [Bacteroidales bacterium]